MVSNYDKPKNEDFTCDKCNSTANTKRKKHVKTVHENTCEECEYTASDKQHLKQHIKLNCQINEIKKQDLNKNDVVEVETKKRKNDTAILASTKKLKV